MAEMMIIDTDAGIDDAQALMLALSNPSRCSVVAITCVSGNVELPKVYLNVLRVLKLCNRLEIPVYQGCQKALIPGGIDGSLYHGEDGLGGVANQYPLPGDEYRHLKGHASVVMVDLVRKNPGKISMMALGPLTNLAVAQRLDSDFLRLLKELVIMGGTVNGVGNVTPVAEFNFFVDPEAVSVVLGEASCKTRILPFDACMRSNLDWPWYDQWTTTGTERGNFVRAINAAMVDRYRNVLHYPGFIACDPLAVAAVIDPACVIKTETLPAVIELLGSTTRGALVVDHRSNKGKAAPPLSFEFLAEFNMVAVKEMYMRMLRFEAAAAEPSGAVYSPRTISMESLQNSTASENLLIVDTDGTVGDALAILLACTNPERCKLLAITCVMGFVPMSTAYSNTLRILNFCARQQNIPVYMGCKTSLVNKAQQKSVRKSPSTDDMSRMPDDLPLPKDVVEVPRDHAAVAMTEIVAQYPGAVTLVALAPLTNVAVAHRLDPGFLRNLKELVIVGGTTQGQGSLSAETSSSFTYDPEAANMILTETQCKTRLVPYETCLSHALEWDWYQNWVNLGTKNSELIKRLTALSVDRQRNVLKRPGFVCSDLVTMATALDPSVTTSSERFPASVEFRGTVTRGMLVVDRCSSTQWNKFPPIKFPLQFNNDVFKALITKMAV
ncbi:uncharacterized protein LOC135400326 [Ornithodoros turicata]|uniref:uncharacterized protein LOC135400326 n=1 Tax=Ornithodoros turicata TaxID=34597 RepID=UPI00313A4A65